MCFSFAPAQDTYAISSFSIISYIWIIFFSYFLPSTLFSFLRKEKYLLHIGLPSWLSYLDWFQQRCFPFLIWFPQSCAIVFLSETIFKILAYSLALNCSWRPCLFQSPYTLCFPRHVSAHSPSLVLFFTLGDMSGTRSLSVRFGVKSHPFLIHTWYWEFPPTVFSFRQWHGHIPCASFPHSCVPAFSEFLC